MPASKEINREIIPAQQVQTIRVMSEAGPRTLSSYNGNGLGDVWRPNFKSPYGGRIANFQTLYDFFINNVPDPDTALAQNPDFDEILRQHPDVRGCMNIREKTVASMPVRFEAGKGSGTEGDEALCNKVKDYISERWFAIPRYFAFYEQAQQAILIGGQGHEFIWQNVDGTPAPVSFAPVHKSRFTFDRDGNMALLTRIAPVWGGYVRYDPQAQFPVGPDHERLNPVFFPAGKFTYHQYSTGAGGTWTRTADEGYLYYGRGEDVNLYTPVTFDNFVMRFQVKWLEKFGIPFAKIYYNDGIATPDDVKNIVESIRGEGSIQIPFPGGTGTQNDNYMVEFEQLNGTGYQCFSDFHDRYITPRVEKILLGGASQMQVEAGGYAAAVSQKDFGPNMIYRWDGKCISETLNTQLIPAMVLAKWPGMPLSYMPRHILEPKEEVDREMQIGILTEAAGLVAVREDDIYEAAGIAKPKKGDATVFLGGNPMDELNSMLDGGRPKVKPGKRDKSMSGGGKKPVGKQGASVGGGNGKGKGKK